MENFQMQEVSVTTLQADRFMKTALEDELKDTAEHKQNERVSSLCFRSMSVSKYSVSSLLTSFLVVTFGLGG